MPCTVSRLNATIVKRSSVITKDQSYYIDLLNRYRKRLGCRLYGYILVTNHLQIILETPRTNIGRFMQGLGTSYVAYFNRRYKRSGTLFDGRYKSLLLPKDQLINFTGQIHRLCRWVPVLKENKNGINPTLGAPRMVSSNRPQIDGADLIKAKDIIRQISLTMGLDGDGEMQKRSRKAIAQHLTMYLIRKETQLTLLSIGTLLGVKAGAVAIAVGKVEKRIQDGRFPDRVETLVTEIGLFGAIN